MIGRARPGALLVAVFWAIGCGGSDREMLQVAGAVKNADGSAIAAEQGGKILFVPDGSGAAAAGAVEQDGSFTMMTNEPGDGVQPGTYKVVLQVWKDYRAGTLAVPQKYGDAATTPLTATVSPEQTHFDFVVER
jgi:hypothetical protein